MDELADVMGHDNLRAAMGDSSLLPQFLQARRRTFSAQRASWSSPLLEVLEDGVAAATVDILPTSRRKKKKRKQGADDSSVGDMGSSGDGSSSS